MLYTDIKVTFVQMKSYNNRKHYSLYYIPPSTKILLFIAYLHFFVFFLIFTLSFRLFTSFREGLNINF